MGKIIKETIHAKGYDISIYTSDFENEFISLTDIARYRNDTPHDVIKNWLRSRETLEFLGLWERLHNPDFKQVEFDLFRGQAGLNAFTMSPQKWIEGVGAIGMISKAGRYGGTYAHSDIAFEFASWISAEFKLYIIKDYKRLNYGRTDFAEWTDCNSDRKFILQIPEARGCKLWISKDGKVLQMYGDAILQK